MNLESLQYLSKPIRIFEITRKSRWLWLCTLQIFLANMNARNVCEMFHACKLDSFSLVILKVFNSIIRHYLWWYYKFMRYQHVLRTTWLRNQFSYNPKWILTSYIRKITVLRIKLIVRDGMKIWKRHKKFSIFLVRSR